MFRQSRDLDPADRALLDAMMQNLLARRTRP
jgi:hypothetical protein